MKGLRVDWADIELSLNETTIFFDLRVIGRLVTSLCERSWLSVGRG